MAYDIPPQLHHKEKIMFGLTFAQLAYAFPAFLIIFLLVFKTSLPKEASIMISSLVVAVASFFMFFDGLDRMRNLVKHLRNKEAHVNSEALKGIIDIKRVKKQTVITKHGDLAVLEVIPLNLMIKTKEEQEQIIQSFQKFLNSLDFPIQIHVSSSPINLDDHFNHLKANTLNNPELFVPYKLFIENTIAEHHIKNRKFFVIIKKKDDLAIQSKVCEDKLKSIGLKVQRLNDKQLLSLFQETINDKTQKKLQADEIMEDYIHFLIAPQKVFFHHDSFETAEMFCRILAVTGYPHSVEMGFLDKIISSGENYDVSLHIEPFPIELTMVQLNHELQKQQADLYADSKKGIINPSLEIKYKSTRQVLEDLQKGKQKLFNVSLYIMCKGELHVRN